ncbi:MAG: hypothetical protein EBE86_025255 [Hormoscilla sp. GUM202]|nr:hypothetical protein [Hormoscilla sp. GUM202]
MVESLSIIKNLQTMLDRVKSHSLGSESLATWAEEQYWLLMEGERKDDDTLEAEFLRDILADVMAQWECLLADVYYQKGKTATAEFPQEWIADWKSQVNSCLPTVEVGV